MIPETLGAALLVTEAFEALGVTYAIGGSLASGVHGVVRATHDADIVADLRAEHAGGLVERLGGAFYVPRDSLRRAIDAGGSFNLIHRETMFKIDVFVARSGILEQAQLRRRRREIFSREPLRQAYVTSPEDTILAKLRWYDQGGRTSEKQWRDVAGIVRVQAEMIDRDYLRRVAGDLGLGALVEQLLAG